MTGIDVLFFDVLGTIVDWRGSITTELRAFLTRNGAGHVEWVRQEGVLRALRARYPAFGGVMGWEYFNSLPGAHERPWEWAANMAGACGCTCV